MKILSSAWPWTPAVSLADTSFCFDSRPFIILFAYSNLSPDINAFSGNSLNYVFLHLQKVIPPGTVLWSQLWKAMVSSRRPGKLELRGSQRAGWPKEDGSHWAALLWEHCGTVSCVPHLVGLSNHGPVSLPYFTRNTSWSQVAQIRTLRSWALVAVAKSKRIPLH